MCIMHAHGTLAKHMIMQDVKGNTALIQACDDEYIETARVLLDHGASVDHRNKV